MPCEENNPSENSGHEGTQKSTPDENPTVTQEERDRINEAAMKGRISPETAAFLAGETKTTGTATW